MWAASNCHPHPCHCPTHPPCLHVLSRLILFGHLKYAVTQVHLLVRFCLWCTWWHFLFFLARIASVIVPLGEANSGAFSKGFSLHRSAVPQTSWLSRLLALHAHCGPRWWLALDTVTNQARFDTSHLTGEWLWCINKMYE